jgi:acyl carrier protein
LRYDGAEEESMTPPDGVDISIFERVVEAFCEALELDPEEVSFHDRVLAELGAESLDLLDVVFRLERAFNIQIPRGGLEARARDLADQPGEIDGRLTEAGAIALRQAMPEVPEQEIQPGMRTDDLASVFRVGTFYFLVVRILDEGGRSSA